MIEYPCKIKGEKIYEKDIKIFSDDYDDHHINRMYENKHGC
jgi:hypothetical protein